MKIFRNKISKEFQFFLSEWAYVANSCETKAFSCGVVTHYDDTKEQNVADRMSLNIGMSFNIFFGDHIDGGPQDWPTKHVDSLIEFAKGDVRCLRNVPQKVFRSPTCGNGFVEPGEECDCGLSAACKNSCCDASTCKLKPNAKCATGKCCDLTTCRPHSAGFECRSAVSECDSPEYCDGRNEFYPTDYFIHTNATCAMGDCCDLKTCRSHKTRFECRSASGECDSPEYCDGYSNFCPNNQLKRDNQECGNGKICLNQQCVGTTKLRTGKSYLNSLFWYFFYFLFFFSFKILNATCIQIPLYANQTKQTNNHCMWS